MSFGIKKIEAPRIETQDEGDCREATAATDERRAALFIAISHWFRRDIVRNKSAIFDRPAAHWLRAQGQEK